MYIKILFFLLSPSYCVLLFFSHRGCHTSSTSTHTTSRDTAIFAFPCYSSQFHCDSKSTTTAREGTIQCKAYCFHHDSENTTGEGKMHEEKTTHIYNCTYWPNANKKKIEWSQLPPVLSDHSYKLGLEVANLTKNLMFLAKYSVRKSQSPSNFCCNSVPPLMLCSQTRGKQWCEQESSNLWGSNYADQIMLPSSLPHRLMMTSFLPQFFGDCFSSYSEKITPYYFICQFLYKIWQ